MKRSQLQDGATGEKESRISETSQNRRRFRGIITHLRPVVARIENV